MTPDEFPVTFQSRRGGALALVIFMVVLVLTMIAAVVAAVQLWPQLKGGVLPDQRERLTASIEAYRLRLKARQKTITGMPKEQ